MEHGHIMADIVTSDASSFGPVTHPTNPADTLREVLEVCDDYDIAMVEVGNIKIVFNPALGPMPEDTVPTESESGEEGDTYTRLMNGEPPKFNNE
jgi:hypothetical protein